MNFAVCLAAFNGMAFIESQINSILEQQNVTVQVFISVDASTDGTEAFLANWCLSEPRLTLLPVGQRFGGAAPNFFRLLRELEFAGFDYLCFSDQDDIWHPGKLWRAHEVLTAHEAAAYSSNVRAFWPDGRTRLIHKAQPQKRWDFLFEAAGPGCTYVLRQDLMLAVQHFVRSRWQALQSVALHDWLTYAFARANGYQWVIDSSVGMDYRQHAANQVGVNAGWQAFVYRIHKVLSGWGLAQAALIAEVLDLDTTPFVQTWKTKGRLGMLWLAFNANHCRRRGRDKVFFALSCMALAVVGRSGKA